MVRSLPNRSIYYLLLDNFAAEEIERASLSSLFTRLLRGGLLGNWVHDVTSSWQFVNRDTKMDSSVIRSPLTTEDS